MGDPWAENDGERDTDWVRTLWLLLADDGDFWTELLDADRMHAVYLHELLFLLSMISIAGADLMEQGTRPSRRALVADLPLTGSALTHWTAGILSRTQSQRQASPTRRYPRCRHVPPTLP